MSLVAIAGDVFAGFFARGIERAGFDVVAHIANVNYAVKTFSLNFPGVPTFIGSETWINSDINACVLESGHKSIDLLFTNPPCAAWSSAGVSHTKESNSHNEKWKEDPRIHCASRLGAKGRELNVKTFVWESVTNAWKNGRDFVDAEAQKWMDAGYHVTVFLQNNLFVGGTQNRKRMLFIAHKYPLVWPIPVTKHKTVSQLLAQKGVKHDGGKMLEKDLAEVWKYATTHGYKETMASVVQKGLVKKPRTMPGFMWKIAKPDRVPNVITSMFLHPTEPRYLTSSETAALCGIPLDWKFASKSTAAQQAEMSRCVHPEVGRWLGTAIANGLKEKPLNSKKPTYRVANLLGPELYEEVIK